MGSPLRVLHVVVNMNRGGAETLIMNLYRNIDRSKIQFDFLTCKAGVFDSEIKNLGGQIYQIPYISDVGHWKYVRELKNFFTANAHYKIVHSHLDKMSGLVLRAAKQAGIPIRISHSHNTRSEGGRVARVYKWFVGNYIVPNSTHLVACSRDASNWLFKEKKTSTMILKNGIEPDKFNFSSEIRKKIRKELNIEDTQFVLGHVGRFNNQKNHSFMLDVFSQFNSEEKDSVLILVGDGDLRPEIEKKIKELNLQEKVQLLGIRSDINHVLQAFDLFIFPSLHEGLPVSLIEAQGAGLPCVISDHISREVDLGFKLIEYASLSKQSCWIEIIKNSKSAQIDRNGVLDLLLKSGFNISNTAGFLEDYYFSLSR